MFLFHLYGEEPFGNVGVEGVASGAVTISSNRGGLPEAVGKPGVLFDPSDEESFTHALQEAKELKFKLGAEPLERERYIDDVNMHLQSFEEGRILEGIFTAFSS